MEALLAAQGNIVLRVEIIFRGNLSHDSPHIGIRRHAPPVDTESNLSLLEGRGVITRLLPLLLAGSSRLPFHSPGGSRFPAGCLVGGVLHCDPLISEQIIPQLINTPAQHPHLLRHGVDIVSRCFRSLCQHIGKLPQGISGGIQLPVKDLQIAGDPAASVGRRLGHIGEMCACAVTETPKRRLIAVVIIRNPDGQISRIPAAYGIFLVAVRILQFRAQTFQVIPYSRQLLIIKIPELIGGLTQKTCRIGGLPQTFGQCLCQGSRLAAVTVQILMGRVHQIKQLLRLPINFAQLVIQILYLQKRLHLPGNASGVLSSVDLAFIGAVLHIPLMESSHNTSRVVAHMPVSHRSRVGTVIDFALGIPSDSPCVSVGSHV